MFKRISAIILCLAALISVSGFADVGAMNLTFSRIEEEAFSGDTSLTTVTINEGVSEIRAEAFKDCSGIETVYCFSEDVSIADSAFDGVENAVIYCYCMSTMDVYAQGKGFTVKYLDGFETECDTAEGEACICLPITWSVVNPMPGRSVSSTFTYRIFKEGSETPVAEKTTSALTFTYTPTAGGVYYAEITMKNSYTTTTFETEPLTVANVLTMGTWEGKPVTWKILSVSGNRALVLTEKLMTRKSYFNPSWIKFKYTYWSGSNIGIESTNYKGSGAADSSNAYKRRISHTNVPLKRDESAWGTEDDLFYLHARFWCNDTFYNGAFTADEQKRILSVTNTNPDSNFDQTVDGVKKHFHVDGGPDTTDKIFFLSYDELLRYIPNNADRKVSEEMVGTTMWWLRTPGAYRVNAMYVTTTGSVSMYGSDVGHTLGYRPAMWIKIGS